MQIHTYAQRTHKNETGSSWLLNRFALSSFELLRDLGRMLVVLSGRRSGIWRFDLGSRSATAITNMWGVESGVFQSFAKSRTIKQKKAYILR